MNLRLEPFDFARAAARAGLAPDGTRLPAGGATAIGGANAIHGANAPGESFQTAIASALRSVSEAQQKASTMQREFQLGNPTVSLEDTMVAMQKSQLGFQAVLAVRSRFVQAYSEVMNMQV